MSSIIYAFLWLLALWKWGDWRNWEKYYATILFFIMGDFIYLYLLSDHFPMWKYDPLTIDSGFGFTSSHISLIIMYIKYPATMLIYLANFPKSNKLKQFLYFTGWVVFYSINEVIDLHLKFIKHFNGWNIWWSALFNVVMFFILLVHFKKPPVAWLLSICFILFLWNWFEVPSTVFR
ncbi:CBO0543 family protein [Robertmurraya massiliosenegalensis]|uniref:CBO0543 family protein n=1 Tax=Robertmurraya massiliosenegalensis TaxID=1287657 RepID=UPI0002E55238|nr:CBO0543 family protein [Robertmurraya massiliosenegalensis]